MNEPHPLRSALVEQLADRILSAGLPVSEIQAIRDLVDSILETRRAPRPLGEQIRSARIRAGWTLTRTADETGLTRQNISLWENGTNLPSADSLIRLATALQVTFTIYGEGILSPRAPASIPDGETVSSTGLSSGSGGLQ